jgi:preprotein translocase subunit YajC
LLDLLTKAYAEGGSAAPSASGGGGLQMFILPVVIILIFYFLLIRPNQKKEKDRKKMIDSLQKGDKVITNGGIYGTVSSIKAEEGIVVLKIAEGAKVEFAKTAIQGKVS